MASIENLPALGGELSEDCPKCGRSQCYEACKHLNEIMLAYYNFENYQTSPRHTAIAESILNLQDSLLQEICEFELDICVKGAMVGFPCVQCNDVCELDPFQLSYHCIPITNTEAITPTEYTITNNSILPVVWVLPDDSQQIGNNFSFSFPDSTPRTVNCYLPKDSTVGALNVSSESVTDIVITAAINMTRLNAPGNPNLTAIDYSASVNMLSTDIRSISIIDINVENTIATQILANNGNVESVTLPLAGTATQLWIYNNATFDDTVANLSLQTNMTQFRAFNCNMSQSNVSQVLQDIDSQGASNQDIRVQNNSTLDAAACLAVANIVGRGGTVIYDAGGSC